jgi:hypothetical protein
MVCRTCSAPVLIAAITVTRRRRESNPRSPSGERPSLRRLALTGVCARERLAHVTPLHGVASGKPSRPAFERQVRGAKIRPRGNARFFRGCSIGRDAACGSLELLKRVHASHGLASNSMSHRYPQGPFDFTASARRRAFQASHRWSASDANEDRGRSARTARWHTSRRPRSSYFSRAPEQQRVPESNSFRSAPRCLQPTPPAARRRAFQAPVGLPLGRLTGDKR